MSPHNLTARARELRRRSTDAERLLWTRLRNRGLRGVKFRRQAQVGHHVVDSLCMEHGLIVEVDGGHHADQQADDDYRTLELESRGYQVVRFWNNDVLQRPDSVLEAILQHLDPAP